MPVTRLYARTLKYFCSKERTVACVSSGYIMYQMLEVPAPKTADNHTFKACRHLWSEPYLVLKC